MRRIEDARALRIHRATLGYKPSGMSAAEMRARLLVLLPKIEARCSSHGGAEDDGNHEICLDYAGRIKKMLAEYPPTAIAVPVASPSPTAAKSPVSVPEELSPRRPERVVKVITVVKSKPAQQAPPVQH